MKMMSEVCESKIALIDNAWANSVDIFTNRQKVKIVADEIILKRRIYAFDQITLEVWFPDRVSVSHETLLLAILMIAREKGMHLEFDERTTMLQDVEGDAPLLKFGKVSMTSGRLLEACGLPKSGNAFERLERHLSDLSKIHLKVKAKDRVAQSSILGFEWSKNRDQITVHICWRFAQAIFGKHWSATINMNDRLRLENDVGRTLHRWIASHLWSGKSAIYKLETLVLKCWREPTESSSTQRWRKREVIQALKDIGNLDDWDVDFEPGDRVTIRRR